MKTIHHSTINSFISEEDTPKEKNTVYDTIFTKRKDGEYRDFSFGDLPKDLNPTDVISYYSDEGFYSENNSWEPHTEIQILRPRLETDEELSKRIESFRVKLERSRKQRQRMFLKLREEFEVLNASPIETRISEIQDRIDNHSEDYNESNLALLKYEVIELKKRSQNNGNN